MGTTAAASEPAVFTSPVVPVIKDAAKFSREWHRHGAAQLIYAVSGTVCVTSDAGTWVVPPNRAVWVPAGVRHATRSYGPVQFRAVFVAPGSDAQLPSRCCVVEVTPLLRELILRLAALGGDQKSGDFEQRIAQLLLDELSFLPIQPLNLPMPGDVRLARLCAEIQDHSQSDATLEDTASKLGMSRSTFMRHFQRETGMSFGQWRRQARLLKSLRLLAQGRSILNVALDCGYQSPSAFTAAFRRILDKSPRDFFEKHGS
jgi:AraC-like DNA-binding protein